MDLTQYLKEKKKIFKIFLFSIIKILEKIAYLKLASLPENKCSTFIESEQEIQEITGTLSKIINPSSKALGCQ